jgi:hypothetical protein
MKTPVQRIQGFYFKRQDLYKPFPDSGLCGAKVAQCEALMRLNAETIRKAFNSTVITGTSVHSPQGLIVARVAKELGFQCKLVFGATKEDKVLTHPFVRKAVELGNTTYDIQCGVGYNSALYARVDELCKEYPMFSVGFGMHVESNESPIVRAVSSDVMNFPSDVTSLVIPVGSGICAGSILAGLKKYARHNMPEKIFCVQIAGYDRTETIHKIAGKIDYEYVMDKTYPYTTLLDRTFTGIRFDPRYEAKAWEWMTKNLDKLGSRPMFWIIGNTYYV